MRFSFEDDSLLGKKYFSAVIYKVLASNKVYISILYNKNYVVKEIL